MFRTRHRNDIDWDMMHPPTFLHHRRAPRQMTKTTHEWRRESSHSVLVPTQKKTNLYTIHHIYIHIIFVYIQFLGLGPVNLPPGMCVVRLSLCGKPARYVFENTAPHCTAPLFCFLIAFFLSLNLCRFASCQMTSTMAWNNIRVLTLPCCPSFWGASYLMKKLEKLSGFLDRPKMRRRVGDVDFTGDTCRWFPLMLWKKASVYMGILRVFFGKYLDWSRWQFFRIQGAKG